MSHRPDTGEMQRRITIKTWSDVPNAAFGIDQTFDAGIQRWAKVAPIHGLSIRFGMQTGEVPTHLFWVRYGPDTRPEDFTANHVIEWQGRRYRVLDAIDVNNDNRFTRISTKDLGDIS